MGMGLVSTVAQAFDRYLGKGKPGYVPRKCPTAQEGVALLKAAARRRCWPTPAGWGWKLRPCTALFFP